MDQSEVIISIEGVSLQSCYVVKELSAVRKDAHQHFFFQTPDKFITACKLRRSTNVCDKMAANDYELNNSDFAGIRFARKHLSGFDLSIDDDTYIPNNLYEHIIKDIAKRSNMIYYYGDITHKILKKVLALEEDPTPLIDVCQILGEQFHYQKELLPSFCGKVHLSRYCSLSKAFYIRKKLKETIKFNMRQ